MKKIWFTSLLLTFSLVLTPGTLPAQSTDEETVIVTLSGQNRNRTLAGVLNVECGYDTEPHGAPFGNWGVASNYGDIEDTTQFRGWRYDGGESWKYQWNSCTTLVSEYLPPNCSYYNDNGCLTQRSDSIVTHGQMSYKYSATACPAPGTVGGEPGNGALDLEGSQASQTSNHMILYELDGWFGGPSGDGHDLVETLYFPGTSVTFTGCTYEGCPERTSGWVDVSSDTSSAVDVDAQLRMKARATLQGFCDWDAGE